MTLREVCNLVYMTLADGRDRPEMAELDRMLAPPEEQEKVMGQINRESMAALGLAPLVPVPKVV